MTTHHFGTDVNAGLVFEDASGAGAPVRVPTGTTIQVKDGSIADPTTGSTLSSIVTLDDGYWEYTTTDIPSIWVRGTAPDGTVEWMGPFYSREYQAAAHYTKTEADARFATIGGGASSVTSSNITDATTVGRQILTAADAAAVRTASGSLAASSVSSFAATFLDDTSASAVRTTIGALGSTDIPVFDLASTPSTGDVLTWDADSGDYTPLPSNVPPVNPFTLLGAVVNPGDPIPADFPPGGLLFTRASAPVLGASLLAQGGSSSSTTTLTLTLGAGVSTSEDIFVAISAAAPGTVLSTVTITDTASTSYAQRGQRLQGSTVQVQVYKGRPGTGIASGSAITITLGAAVGDLEVIVFKGTGLLTSSFDQQGLNSGTGLTTLALTASAATAQANELVIAAVGFNQASNSLASIPAGWTQIGTTQPTTGGASAKYLAVLWKQVTSISTPTVTVGINTAGVMVGVLDTFKAA